MSLGKLYKQPEQVVDARWNPRAKITWRAGPLQVEDVCHDGPGEGDKALLAGEVPDDAIVEDEDVLA
jgi:hypothetical protein